MTPIIAVHRNNMHVSSMCLFATRARAKMNKTPQKYIHYYRIHLYLTNPSAAVHRGSTVRYICSLAHTVLLTPWLPSLSNVMHTVLQMQFFSNINCQTQLPQQHNSGGQTLFGGRKCNKVTATFPCLNVVIFFLL